MLLLLNACIAHRSAFSWYMVYRKPEYQRLKRHIEKLVKDRESFRSFPVPPPLRHSVASVVVVVVVVLHMVVRFTSDHSLACILQFEFSTVPHTQCYYRRACHTLPCVVSQPLSSLHATPTPTKGVVRRELPQQNRNPPF